MIFKFQGHEFQISPEGILFWLEKKIAIVSDLHLEKGSSYAASGQFIPPYDSLDTLNNLIKSIEKNKVSDLILVGDVFHDQKALERMSEDVKSLFKSLIKRYKTIFVRGNHDASLILEGVYCCDEYVLENIHFVHEASKKNINQISGHFHPIASLKVNSKKIMTKCLVVSKNSIILPSFGKYTGGLNINKPPLKKFIDINSIIYLLNKSSVYRIPLNHMKDFL